MPDKIDLEGFIKHEIEGKVTDYKNPKCIDCAECCSMTAFISEMEYQKLKKYLRKDPKGRRLWEYGLNLIVQYWKKGTIYLVCPFVKNKKCEIYDIRPEICRKFHCSPELLAPDYDKFQFGDRTIADLFKKEIKYITGGG